MTTNVPDDLRPGDFVELVWPSGTLVRGKLTEFCGGLDIADAGWTVLRRDGRTPMWQEEGAILTVVSRAPRPLYVNHDRTKPKLGDVVQDAVRKDGLTWVFADASERRPWLSPALEMWTDRHDLPMQLRLLVDGETGQIVPSEEA